GSARRLGDYEAVQKKTPGLSKDEAEARELLGLVGDLGMTDRLIARRSEKDGPALAKPTPGDSSRQALSASWDKVQSRAQREAPRKAPRPAVKETGPEADGWRSHLEASWDRN